MNQQLSITRKFLFAFVVFAVATIVLDVLQERRLISNLSESGLRAFFVLIFASIVLFTTWRAELPRSVKTCFYISTTFFVVEVCLAFFEDFSQHYDIAQFDSKSNPIRHLEKLTTLGWVGSILVLSYVLTRSLEVSQVELRREVEEKTKANKALGQLNKQLETTLDDLKQTQDAVVQQERLAALGQLSSGIAHDLNNTLTPILAYSDLLRHASLTDVEKHKTVVEISNAASHAADIVKQLQFFYTRNSSARHTSISARDIAVEAIELTTPKWRNANLTDRKTVDVVFKGDDPGIVTGNRIEIKQVVANLILNAVDAITTSGRVEVSVESHVNDILIKVSDNGEGMSNESLQHCLEPFYTTKPNGTGLGLSVCHGIVERHGGSISVTSEEGIGTSFQVVLPMAPLKVEETAQFSLEERRANRSADLKILLVDDDQRVRDSATMLLNQEFDIVVTASSGETGLANMEQREFDLVVCDLGMPGMSGSCFVERAKKRWPHVPIIIASGWSEDRVAEHFKGISKPDAIIQKPLSRSLLKTVYHLIDKRSASPLTDCTATEKDKSVT